MMVTVMIVMNFLTKSINSNEGARPTHSCTANHHHYELLVIIDYEGVYVLFQVYLTHFYSSQVAQLPKGSLGNLTWCWPTVDHYGLFPGLHVFPDEAHKPAIEQSQMFFLDSRCLPIQCVRALRDALVRPGGEVEMGKLAPLTFLFVFTHLLHCKLPGEVLLGLGHPSSSTQLQSSSSVVLLLSVKFIVSRPECPVHMLSLFKNLHLSFNHEYYVYYTWCSYMNKRSRWEWHLFLAPVSKCPDLKLNMQVKSVAKWVSAAHEMHSPTLLTLLTCLW